MKSFDLYDAALVGCKALTLLGYAKKKDIPVTDLRLTTTDVRLAAAA